MSETKIKSILINKGTEGNIIVYLKYDDVMKCIANIDLKDDKYMSYEIAFDDVAITINGDSYFENGDKYKLMD